MFTNPIAIFLKVENGELPNAKICIVVDCADMLFSNFAIKKYVEYIHEKRRSACIALDTMSA